MHRKSGNIAAIISLMTSFAGVAGVCVYAGFNWGKGNADDAAYEEGYQAFESELSACHDAQKVAGQALGHYILGENNVTETDLDAAEDKANELCEKFEFTPN